MYTKQYKIILRLLILLLAGCIYSSCNKYLDKKPSKSQVVPSTYNDLLALMDNGAMNSTNITIREIMADDIYLHEPTWQSFIAGGGGPVAFSYIWDKDIYPLPYDWDYLYQTPIFISNLVLDELDKVSANEGTKGDMYDYLRGAALFYRSFAFYNLAQISCDAYSNGNASKPGDIIRLTADINAATTRATVQETYDRILTDLREASVLLPLTTVRPTRPSKVAAYAALARVHLSMRAYDSAAKYASLALNNYNTLVDYNSLIPVSAPPIKVFNPEVVYHADATNQYFLTQAPYARIDSFLYSSYDDNDLRKQVFFTTNTGIHAGTHSFRGSYFGTKRADAYFDGFTTGELYLTRAESFAKQGKVTEAMDDLNTLLIKRWKQNTFIPLTANTADDALRQIRVERRKELVYRGQRWTDLRRYNLEDSSITLIRHINNTDYTLPPGDNRWTLLLPIEEVVRGGITQNPR